MTLFGIRLLQPLSERQWRAGLVLLVFYVAATRLSDFAFAAPGLIFPASGIALAGLFLEGYALWPFVFVASLLGYVLSGSGFIYLLILPVAHTLQAVFGTYLLRKASLDPLFRKLKDMFSLIIVALVASLVVPTLGSLARTLHYYFANLPPSTVTWSSWYAANVFSLLIITPFILRWFTKPRFARRTLEWVEIVVAFGFLGALSYLLFFTTTTSIVGISLVYFLLVPLFWIALRLRPRFITLALIVLSCFALGSLYFGPVVLPTDMLGTRLFQTEIFLEIIASIFFILSSLEEDRRVTANLMKSQVSTLENAVVKLGSQDRAKSEFIAMLAHELRNPLAPIASSIDLLRLKEPQGEERAELLDLMDDRMQTVRRLLDDLLDVSRIEENKLSLKMEPADVGDIARKAIVSTEHYFKERHQLLSLELPDARLIAQVDPVRLEQVVSNLLTNASKFSDPGATITLALRHDGTVGELSVADTGVGIEPDMLGRIFEPFLQIEQGARTRKGLGIGLSLVRSLVHMHGGSVRVASDGPGKGSRFYISLPLLRVEDRTADTGHEKKSEERAAKKAGGISVLIVDDNDTAASSIGKLLELSGCTVGYAYDGAQALERAAAMKPDAILLDIGLPDQDGYAVAKKLRAAGFTGRLVALTGYSLEEDRQKGRDAGFTDYLVKPAGLADLRRTLIDAPPG